MTLCRNGLHETEGPCRECKRARSKRSAPRHNRRSAELKSRLFAAYGGKCACCGEAEPMFLVIDHVGGGGTAHRRVQRQRSIYLAIERAGYPPDYRVLCWNCNWGVHMNDGVCPHREKGQWL